MHALVMLQVMQHAECADPKAIHSTITIPYHLDHCTVKIDSELEFLINLIFVRRT